MGKGGIPMFIFIGIGVVIMFIAVFLTVANGNEICSDDNPCPDQQSFGGTNETSVLHKAGDNVGSINSKAIVGFDDGSTMSFAQEKPFLVRISEPLSQSGVQSPDKTDRVVSMEYTFEFMIDDFYILEVSADFAVLACPLNEYCDVTGGSTNTIMLCGDTTPCDVTFDGGVPTVKVDITPFDKENPDRLFQGSEEIRFVFKADYISMTLQSKLDNYLFTATTENVFAIVDLPLDEYQHTSAEFGGGDMDITATTWMSGDSVGVGSGVSLANGVIGKVGEKTYRDDGLCEFRFSNDSSVVVGPCRD